MHRPAPGKVARAAIRRGEAGICQVARRFCCKGNDDIVRGQWEKLIQVNYAPETGRPRNNAFHARTISRQHDHMGVIPPAEAAVLHLLKALVGSSNTPSPSIAAPTTVAYPRPMAEMVEYLVLLQACGTAPDRGRKGNLLWLGTLLSEDAYCLGYLHGMFDSLCEQWDVPATERRLVVGTASTIFFRDLLDGCCDPRGVGRIEDTAFNGLHTLANDPGFRRGMFDGCTELTRYTATGEVAHMPSRLHDRLRQVTEAA